MKLLAKLQRDRTSKSSLTVNQLGWGSPDRLLVSVAMPSIERGGFRARKNRLLVVDVTNGWSRYLGQRWPDQRYIQQQDNIVSYLRDDPGGVLIALWLPGDPGVGVRRVDLKSGNLRSVIRPRPGTLRWAADHRDHVRIGWGEAESVSRNFIYARTNSTASFEKILEWNPHRDEKGFRFAGFAPDPGLIYVYAQSEHGRLAVFPYNIATRKLGEALFSDPHFDVGHLCVSKVDGRLLSVSYVADIPKIAVLDDARRKAHAAIDAALAGRINAFVSSDANERRFVIRSSSDTVPPAFYLYDATDNSLSPLFDAYPELARAKFAPMKPISYPARDGLEIPGYLTVPVDGTQAPYPLIVMPHGGPWTRDVWGWDPVVQFLVSRGFAVVQPNFRGSSGYGADFQRKGRGRWGLEMQDDITDAALWAVEQGIADRARIGIYGSSYGGYAALRAMQKEPTLFRAAASFAGVTDLPTLLEDDSRYYGLVDDMEALIGDRRADRRQLEEASPARGAGRIQGAVLIAHGSEDPRVQVGQATLMVRALENAGRRVEAYIYDGEVHGFLDERNAIDFYTRLATFFERELRALSKP